MALLVAALAAVMGVMECAMIVEFTSAAREFPPVWIIIANGFGNWAPWIVVAPLVAFLGTRFRLGAGRRRHLVVHIAAAALLSFGFANIPCWVPPFEVMFAGDCPEGVCVDFGDGHSTSYVGPPMISADGDEALIGGMTLHGEGGIAFPAGTGDGEFLSPPFLLAAFSGNFVFYSVCMLFITGVQLYRAVREREAHADRLQAELMRAQLATLRMQLHPHFLFNTLNSIVTLMPRDVDGARRMVNRLADLLRASFNEMAGHEVPLRTEIDALANYVDIERVRYGENLCVAIDVDANVGAALVPTFCLQPLVENAIAHGVGAHPELGTIRVHAERCDDRVIIEVADDGPGSTDAADDLSYGVGLSNTEKRIEQLYGDGGTLDITRPDSGGFVVRLTIPYHEQSDLSPQT